MRARSSDGTVLAARGEPPVRYPKVTSPSREPDERRGILLLIAAAFSFSLMSVQVKLAGRDLPVSMLVLARGVVTLVLSAAWLLSHRIPMWGHDKTRLVLRGVFGVGGLACFFYAVTALPLAEATVIHYLNPILTSILAALLLAERVDRRLVWAIAASLAGTLLVTRPSALFGGNLSLSTTGVAAALGGAAFSACAYVTVRRLSRTDDPHVIVFYFPVIAVPVTLPFALADWVWPTPRGWALLIGLGVATQVAQVLFTRGLALVPAGRGTTVGYVQIVFAAAFGALLFDEPLTILTVAGAVLIVGGTLALARRPARR